MYLFPMHAQWEVFTAGGFSAVRAIISST